MYEWCGEGGQGTRAVNERRRKSKSDSPNVKVRNGVSDCSPFTSNGTTLSFHINSLSPRVLRISIPKFESVPLGPEPQLALRTYPNCPGSSRWQHSPSVSHPRRRRVHAYARITTAPLHEFPSPTHPRHECSSSMLPQTLHVSSRSSRIYLFNLHGKQQQPRS